MAAIRNKHFKTGRTTLTIVGNKPNYIPYMNIEFNGQIIGCLIGCDLKELAVNIFRRLGIKVEKLTIGSTVELERWCYDNYDEGVQMWLCHGCEGHPCVAFGVSEPHGCPYGTPENMEWNSTTGEAVEPTRQHTTGNKSEPVDICSSCNSQGSAVPVNYEWKCELCGHRW